MFTGLIEEIGEVAVVRREVESARFAISAPGIAPGVEIGDSISVSGVCLTAVAASISELEVEATPETLSRTSLRGIVAGAKVNLERALAAGARIGGHFVQGHVDGVAILASIKERGNSHIVRVTAPRDFMRFIVVKGSISLDGISLTVVDLEEDSFTVSIIPHTWESTTLRFRGVGDPLNIEVDLIARHIERLLNDRRGVRDVGPPESPITEGMLAKAGFI